LFVSERGIGDARSDIAVDPRKFGPEWLHPPGMRSPDEPTTHRDGLFVIDDCWIGYPLRLELDSDYLEYSSISLREDKFVWSPGEVAASS